MKSSNGKLTFDQLREANANRCEEVFHKIDEWAPMDWGCALAGEVGELCNLLKKKYGRNESVPMAEVAKEIADVQIYLDLLAARLRIDLGAATIQKFNETSTKKKSVWKL